MLLVIKQALFVASVLEDALDAIKIFDHRWRHSGSTGLALSLYLLRLEKLARSFTMYYVCQTFGARLQRQDVVLRVVVGHHVATIIL